MVNCQCFHLPSLFWCRCLLTQNPVSHPLILLVIDHCLCHKLINCCTTVTEAVEKDGAWFQRHLRHQIQQLGGQGPSGEKKQLCVCVGYEGVNSSRGTKKKEKRKNPDRLDDFHSKSKVWSVSLWHIVAYNMVINVTEGWLRW